MSETHKHEIIREQPKESFEQLVQLFGEKFGILFYQTVPSIKQDILRLPEEDREVQLILRISQHPHYRDLLASLNYLHEYQQLCDRENARKVREYCSDQVAIIQAMMDQILLQATSSTNVGIDGKKIVLFDRETLDAIKKSGTSSFYRAPDQVRVALQIDQADRDVFKKQTMSYEKNLLRCFAARYITQPELPRVISDRRFFHAEILLQKTSNELRELAALLDVRKAADRVKLEAIARACLAIVARMQSGTRTAEPDTYTEFAQGIYKKLQNYWGDFLPVAAEQYQLLVSHPEYFTHAYAVYELEQARTGQRFDPEIDRIMHNFEQPFLEWEIPHFEQLLLQNADSMINLLARDVLVRHPDAQLVFFDHSARPLAFLIRQRWEERKKKRNERLPDIPPIKFMSDDALIKAHAEQKKTKISQKLTWPFKDREPSAVIFIDDFVAFGRVKAAVMDVAADFERYFLPFFGRGQDYVYWSEDKDRRVSYMDANYGHGVPWHMLPMTTGVWTVGSSDDAAVPTANAINHFGLEAFKIYVRDAITQLPRVSRHTTEDLDGYGQFTAMNERGRLNFAERVDSLLAPGKEQELKAWILDQSRLLRRRLAKLATL